MEKCQTWSLHPLYFICTKVVNHDLSSWFKTSHKKQLQYYFLFWREGFLFQIQFVKQEKLREAIQPILTRDNYFDLYQRSCSLILAVTSEQQLIENLLFKLWSTILKNLYQSIISTISTIFCLANKIPPIFNDFQWSSKIHKQNMLSNS